jgi:protease-4
VLGCLFALSLLLNLLAAAVILFLCLGVFYKAGLAGLGEDSSPPLTEHHHAGKTGSANKVAIISLDGVIMEGLLQFVHKQIRQAAHDSQVKAVVLRINSPGGSITASDDLHVRLKELADGNPAKQTNPKPLVVSMASMAASGGYYVAMPARTLLAERTTLTGSIGVYATLPNIQKFIEEHGVKVETVKQGQIKDSGSLFKEMSAEERQVWQDMVDHAYQQFVQVVEQGRPKLKGKLLEPITVQPVRAGPAWLHKDKGKEGPYRRYRADGGIFTADKALELGLVDQVGHLDDAVRAAQAAAGLGEDYEAIKYERPKVLAELLLGTRAPQPGPLGEDALEPGRLGAALGPRLWYLAPGHELPGLLAAARAAGR